MKGNYIRKKLNRPFIIKRDLKNEIRIIEELIRDSWDIYRTKEEKLDYKRL